MGATRAGKVGGAGPRVGVGGYTVVVVHGATRRGWGTVGGMDSGAWMLGEPKSLGGVGGLVTAACVRAASWSRSMAPVGGLGGKRAWAAGANGAVSRDGAPGHFSTGAGGDGSWRGERVGADGVGCGVGATEEC